MDRRNFFRNGALLVAGAVAADQLEILDRLGWKRKFFPSVSLKQRHKIQGVMLTMEDGSDLKHELDFPLYVDDGSLLILRGNTAVIEDGGSVMPLVSHVGSPARRAWLFYDERSREAVRPLRGSALHANWSLTRPSDVTTTLITTNGPPIPIL